MKNIWLVLISIIIFSASCNNYEPKHGTPNISQEKMATIAADIHIAEAHLQNIPAVKRDSVKALLYHHVFKIHEIDSTIFYENQTLYYENPKRVEKLYTRILEILDEKEKGL